jgi:flagellar protein FliO/FliZ
MDVISPELSQIARLLIALVTVITLMGGIAFVLKKLGLATPQSIKSNNTRRLKIVESLPLDARKRLMIVECDGREHLIISGASTDTIIEKNIPPVDGSKVSDQSA